MIGRRATLGLTLLSALAFCAFAAQSASAIETKTSKRTTAVTCVEVSPNTGKYNKAHCDKEDTGVGNYEHVEFKGETKEVAATNEKVTSGKEPSEATSKLESAILRGTLFGVKTEITCEKVKNKLDESNISNTEPNKEPHTLSGKIVTEFTKCTVKNPLNCTVTEPIISKATIHGVEGMEGPKGEKNAMGLLFTGAGVEETFAEIQFTGEKCSLKNQVFKVKGKVVATNGPTTESSQENAEAGSTLVFTPKFKMQTLKLGAAEAEFETITTPSRGGKPLAATTTIE